MAKATETDIGQPIMGIVPRFGRNQPGPNLQQNKNRKSVALHNEQSTSPNAKYQQSLDSSAVLGNSPRLGQNPSRGILETAVAQ